MQHAIVPLNGTPRLGAAAFLPAANSPPLSKASRTRTTTPRRLRKLIAAMRSTLHSKLVISVDCFTRVTGPEGDASAEEVREDAAELHYIIRRFLLALNATEVHEGGRALYQRLLEGRSQAEGCLSALDALTDAIEQRRYRRRARRLRCLEQLTELSWRLQFMAFEARGAMRELAKLQAPKTDGCTQ